MNYGIKILNLTNISTFQTLPYFKMATKTSKKEYYKDADEMFADIDKKGAQESKLKK